ncbi:MoxR family ATPase [Aliiglaciecola sp. 2_MG-2023]|uniref:AAA family ATPase n=1 Tax=unclassified Aliiglaciecola TaxID=2593648 RepID=UPI0026E239C5|nr:MULTISPECIES: MoxR family ATPase [unclassified Aliiglaciecola]MDO6713203.1 MoxR family ATPase [Aliiglaciecola sp. 2_MG-2023]MDO6754311.1 MoxR family ATPase [Aliiglaciecola sp. 1_MG-2023]
MTKSRFFDGTLDEPQNNYLNLPVIDQNAMTRPQDYLASNELSAAVNVALTLGMPLLLTGEPGCGKSELARRIAWELGFPSYNKDGNAEVLKYAVKSNTEARDLFYNYDTVGRFHASQASQSPNQELVSANQFIRYQALGLAILRAKGKQGDFPSGLLTDSQLASLPETAHRSVVLIDEIDKAPRDVPNDILNEIEHLEFAIPELGGVRVAIEGNEIAHKPVVIITSNSERDLPSAFLRRCVYFHLPFPPFSTEDDTQVTVQSIVTSRLGKRFADLPILQRDAISLCQFLRLEQQGLYKQPGIAEILNWLSYISQHALSQATSGKFPSTAGLSEVDYQTCILGFKTTLLKTREDQSRADSLFQAWISTSSESTK